MKTLSAKLSGQSWAWFIGVFAMMFYFVFRPTWTELLLFTAVDTCALYVVISWERKYLTRIFPSLLPYQLDQIEPRLPQMSMEEKRRLLEVMFGFPEKFALYCFLSSFVKALPSAALILFVWDRDVSFTAQCLRLFAVTMVVWSYFFGAVYLESHRFLSNKLAEYHRSQDWSEVFRFTQIPSKNISTHFHENVGLGATWIFSLVLQWLLVTTSPPGISNLQLAIEIGAVGLGGMALATHLWQLSRSFFVGGLQTFFERLEGFNPENFPHTLSIHSSPLLARLETAFNALVQKVRSYQGELSRWVLARSEKSRTEAIGELSTLIVHDLSAPLHVAHFCAEQLQTNPDSLQSAGYRSQLSASLEQAVGFVSSLRSYLREDSRTGLSHFGELFPHTWKLLETKFFTKNFHKIQFDVDPHLNDLKFRIPQTDLIHILLNLFSNSAENLIENEISDPRIRLSLDFQNPGCASIVVSDNGTGLSVERFEELTELIPGKATPTPSRKGLGLRLIRRTVERYGGTLHVVRQEPGIPGTTFNLQLPLGPPEDTSDEKIGLPHQTYVSLAERVNFGNPADTQV